MFELNTNRLKIMPLNIQQLELLKDDMEAFEKSIGLNLSDHEKFDEKTEKDIKNAWKFWFTRWEIILKSENKIIGSCGFKGFPNNNGEVEIGYMIKPSYQNKGYMTEALKEMVRFSFMHHRVNHVLAETPQDNFPSHRVLIKNDFEIFKEKENNFWWKHSKYGKN